MQHIIFKFDNLSLSGLTLKKVYNIRLFLHQQDSEYNKCLILVLLLDFIAKIVFFLSVRFRGLQYMSCVLYFRRQQQFVACRRNVNTMQRRAALHRVACRTVNLCWKNRSLKNMEIQALCALAGEYWVDYCSTVLLPLTRLGRLQEWKTS